MTKKQRKKRAVISSIMSLILCLALLLETTMAWFTDTVTNTGNRVESGGMEVQLLKYDGGNYVDITDGTGDIFMTEGEGVRLNGILWEPGKTEVVYLQVKNADTLAFNYNIILSVSNDSENTAALQDVFSYAIVAGDYSQTPFTSWTEITGHALAETGTVPEGTKTAAEKGALAAGASDYFALAVHMDEEAGNDYQYQAINIDVKIVAKQMTHENDSFNNQYDADAVYPGGVTIYPTVEGHGELIVDGGYEATNADDTFTNWELKKVNASNFVETQIVHSGNSSVKFTHASEWARQWVDIEPGGGVYQLTGYVYITEGAEDARFKFEGYTQKELSTEYQTITPQALFSKYSTIVDLELENDGLETGRWMQFSYLVEPTPETEWLMLYMRGGGEAAVYFDDISLRKIKEAESARLKISTNSNFYYANETQGTASLEPNTYLDYSKWTADCRILEGTEVKWEQKGIDLSQGNTEVTFDLTNCTNKVDYVFETVLYEDGVEIDKIQGSFSKKYDRPTVFNEKGLYVEENGEVFHPVMAYHQYKPEEIKRCAEEFGVNLFQLAHGWVLKYEWDTDKDRLIALLDMVREVNGKVVVSLYLNGLICSAPENIEAVEKYMHAFLDEDGVLHEYEDLIFAWAMDDEPVGGGVSEELIATAYEMIREIDPTRPVYTIDQREKYYPTLIRNADIITLDNYPYGKWNAMEYIYDCVEYAVGMAEPSGKPIRTLLQCWPRGTGSFMDGTQELYCPSGNAVRNMIYQSFMAGAVGIGYYGFDYQDTNDTALPNMKDTAMAEGIKEFASKEQDIMFDYFVDKEYVTFNSNVDGLENMRYVSFLKDGKIYMVVLNKHEFAEQTVSVPLTSNNGNVTISSYTAEGYAGGAADIATAVTTGTLDVTLEPGAAAVYIITPAEAISEDALK